MSLLNKKVCLLGAFAVGKTSLVKRFVHGSFDEKYHSTIGVKIDRRTVAVDGTEVQLLLWDIHGEDDFQKVRASYLRGTHGLILVADGTRKETLATALLLRRRVESTQGAVPSVLLLNKSDLKQEWALEKEAGADDDWAGCPVFLTSARTGDHVEAAFESLSKKLTQR